MAVKSPRVDAALLDELSAVAARAAAAIMAFNDRAAGRAQKPDGSPVTDADHESEAVLLDGLGRLLPGVPIVSEEAVGRGARPAPGENFVLVDPLDGTREFLAGRDEFTVNIAVVHNRVPVAGVIAAPARARLWRGAQGLGAERLVLTPGRPSGVDRDRVAIHGRPLPADSIRILTSRSHPDAETERYVARFRNVERVVCGSSLKFCLLAEGAADVYPRFGPTSQWDIAAGHALLAAAGGVVTGRDGEALVYGGTGDDGFLVPGFIAWADAAAARRLA